MRPCISGPKRPQDKIDLSEAKLAFLSSIEHMATEGKIQHNSEMTFNHNNLPEQILTHGFVAIAAITSCTNTSNPAVMLAAGLLAQKACENGLSVPSWVKTSLAPGSQVVTDYLEKTGLQNYLEKLGFHTVGYGCTTCIGNSGPLERRCHEGYTRG